MAGSKTEKPTAKKKKDSAEKGKSFKSKDFVIACLIIIGVQYLINFSGITVLLTLWRRVIENNFVVDMKEYSDAVFKTGLTLFLPFLLLCVAASALPTLLQTGFLLATKALKLNFSSLNPVNGFKKIFSLRTAKDVIKTLLFMGVFIAVGIMFWDDNRRIILSQLDASPLQILMVWGQLFTALIYLCLSCALIVFVLDALAELFLHMKDLKMDKQEVKRERKEQDGDPEIKYKRKELHQELLSEQVKSDIENSKVIVANPTHVAVGIYLNLDVIGIPFISVLETNQRALAVRAYAEKVGVPVVENIKLAHRILKTHHRYSFVSLEELDEVIGILMWLQQVENAWRNEHTEL
ncbi:EscU/YscU/HrcU family type III secretion system export apparatus switch protein [Yersinia kristensenii]|uniref:EscU/YscU/HrcU family type III secretion system export apparatus switch protein n=1 Tax=Yersinia kristensenii TaxID=28152 RepID=UPI0005E113AF|nr:EscU/YscU/HrcU family type III secretion system export apparatus switch protein [Yersinia kristensenii]CNF35078.1 surface presentation of antigens protein SpaS [Yersinia kristensenii]